MGLSCCGTMIASPGLGFCAQDVALTSRMSWQRRTQRHTPPLADRSCGADTCLQLYICLYVLLLLLLLLFLCFAIIVGDVRDLAIRRFARCMGIQGRLHGRSETAGDLAIGSLEGATLLGGIGAFGEPCRGTSHSRSFRSASEVCRNTTESKSVA